MSSRASGYFPESPHTAAFDERKQGSLLDWYMTRGNYNGFKIQILYNLHGVNGIVWLTFLDYVWARIERFFAFKTQNYKTHVWWFSATYSPNINMGVAHRKGKVTEILTIRLTKCLGHIYIEGTRFQSSKLILSFKKLWFSCFHEYKKYGCAPLPGRGHRDLKISLNEMPLSHL